MIEIDSLAFHARGRRDQLVGGPRIEPEPSFYQVVQLAFFSIRRFAIERNDMDEQRRRRELVAGFVERLIFLCSRRDNLSNEMT